MKKVIIAIAFATLITLICGITALAKDALNNPKENSIDYGYLEFKGEKIPITTAEQKKIVDECTSNMADYRLKEALIALNVIPEEQINFTYEDAFSVFETLDKEAGSTDVLKALDAVTGCYDVMMDLNMATVFIYRIPDVGAFTVYAHTPTIANVFYGEQTTEAFKVIFSTGLGFNPEGWTSEDLEKYGQ